MIVMNGANLEQVFLCKRGADFSSGRKGYGVLVKAIFKSRSLLTLDRHKHGLE